MNTRPDDEEMERRLEIGRAANRQWHTERRENRRARAGLRVWGYTLGISLFAWLILGIVSLSRAADGVRVIDGDTLVIESVHHRIYNIDAPEIDQTCTDPLGNSYDCGRMAKNFLQSMVTKAHGFTCTTLGTDKYRRALSVCTIIDANGVRHDVGDEMMRAGWALRYKLRIKGLKQPWDDVINRTHDPEYQAQQNGVGLWQGAFIEPYQWRLMKKGTVK